MDNKEEGFNSEERGGSYMREVGEFYRTEFKDIFTLFFRDPERGVAKIFNRPSRVAFRQSLILYASVFLVFLIGFYILVGQLRDYLTIGIFIMLGLFPVLFMLFVSILTFGLKAFKGRPDPKKELLTGALCGIPLSAILIVLIVARDFIISMISGGSIPGVAGNPFNAGVITVLVSLYILLMIINTCRQSLNVSDFDEVLGWYLSPVVVMVALYLAVSMTSGLF